VYSHIFASMYQGTMMGRPDLLLVFPCLLAHSDWTGNVDLHPKAIASMVGIDEERVRAALAELEADDPESRTIHELYGGKRIVRVDEHRPWGWFIVNFVKYRDMIRAKSIRENARVRQERKRDKDRGVTPESRMCHGASRNETPTSRKGKGKGKGYRGAPLAAPELALSETEGTVPPAGNAVAPPASTKARPASADEVRAEIGRLGYHVDAEAFFAHYQTNGWRQKGGNRITDWKAALVTWERNELKGFGGNGTRPSMPVPAINPTDNEARRRKALGLPLFEPKGAA